MLPQVRFRIVHGVLVVFGLALLAKAAHVQLWQHDRWTREALRQQVAETRVPALRGDIEDVTGVAIARSRELVRIAVAPREVTDRARLRRAMTAAGIPPAEVRRVTSSKAAWVELRQAYAAAAVAAVTRLGGVHATGTGGREYVQSDGARRLLGVVGREGRGLSGLELQLDSLLRGKDGKRRVIRGLRGARFESPDRLGVPPTPGHVVRLTINQALQDICDKSLADAMRRTGADGGDVVVIDPANGEVRCVSSRRPGGSPGSTAAFTEPFEPGSTLKPFFAGRLVESGAATPDEVIETFDGRYQVHGRTVTDVHKASRLSLRDVIRFSSNVGIVRFTERLTNDEIYELLRDLGFGTPTGVSYPSEAAGTLTEPRRWSGQSQASLAIGYEIAVTPLQLAGAYAAIANGGEVVAPALVREVRDAEGRVVYRHRPRRLRRVFEPQTTTTLLGMLESVVDSGTAVDAGLATYALAGKSGTARRSVGGVYGKQSYTATFVGVFPASSPQYVILAKLDNPGLESYYGGKAAAPMAKAVIEAALAARDASLDWERLGPQVLPTGPVTIAPDVESIEVAGSVSRDLLEAPVAPSVPLVDTLPLPAPTPATFLLAAPAPAVDRARPPVAVPDVSGLPVRVAVRELHRAGLRVRLVPGAGSPTAPAAGALVAAGTLIRLTRP